MTRPDFGARLPGVGGSGEVGGSPEASAFRAELADFSKRIADYMATRETPWGRPEEIVAEAIRLLFEDAFFETYPLAVRAKELFGHG